MAAEDPSTLPARGMRADWSALLPAGSAASFHRTLLPSAYWQLALLLGLTLLPLLWPTIPPLVDLPNHMSRYAIGAAYGTSPYFRQWFDFHWVFVGNLGVDIPATFLARWIGVEAATKLVIIAIPLLTVAAMIWLSRLIHGGISLAVPIAGMFAYNYALNYGFVNYTLSAGLALLALALWIHLDQRERTGLRAIVFLPLAMIVWLSHAVGWGVLGLMVFGYELAARQAKGVSLVRAGLGAAVSCLVLCAPLVPMIVWFLGSMQGAPTVFGLRPLRKLSYFLLALRNYDPIVDLASMGFALGLVGLAVASGDFRLDRRLVYPAIMLALIYLVIPDSFLGSGYTDLRIIPYGVVLLLLSIAPVRSSRLVRICALAAYVVFAARTLYVTATYALLGAHYDRELQALSHVPVGSKVFGFERVVCFRDWRDDRLDHLHRIATVRRQAFTNSTWPPTASQTLSVRPYMIANYTDLDSQRFEPAHCRAAAFETIDGSLAQIPRSPFDYYWLIGVRPADWPRRPWLRPVWRGPDAILYRIDRGPASTPARRGA